MVGVLVCVIDILQGVLDISEAFTEDALGRGQPLPHPVELALGVG